MKWTTDIFTAKSNKIHNKFYSYDKVNYINAKTKVIITCPAHGDFLQLPYKHISGNSCMECFRDSKSLNDKSNKFHTNIFNKVHNNFYSYNKFTYTQAKNKIIITCPIHGDFEQGYASHKRGQGCAKCCYDRNRLTQKETIDNFIAIHNNFYNYDKVRYSRSDEKITITCLVHGDFKQTPTTHLRGHGCQKCWQDKRDNYNNRVKYIGRPTTLYYIKVENLYKIGLTMKSVQERFKSELKTINIETIKTWHFNNGEDAFDKEQEIIKMNKMFKYTGPRILASGNTELFTEDVLKLEVNNGK